MRALFPNFPPGLGFYIRAAFYFHCLCLVFSWKGSAENHNRRYSYFYADENGNYEAHRWKPMTRPPLYENDLKPGKCNDSVVVVAASGDDFQRSKETPDSYLEAAKTSSWRNSNVESDIRTIPDTYGDAPKSPDTFQKAPKSLNAVYNSTKSLHTLYDAQPAAIDSTKSPNLQTFSHLSKSPTTFPDFPKSSFHSLPDEFDNTPHNWKQSDDYRDPHPYATARPADSISITVSDNVTSKSNRAGKFFGFGSSSRENDQLVVSLKEVKCGKINRQGAGMFSAVVTTSRGLRNPPVMEGGREEGAFKCGTAILDFNSFRINLRDGDVVECGVRNCDTETDAMCALLRFPSVSGLKTADDAIIRIRCKPPLQSTSITKSLKMIPILKNSISRSLNTISGALPTVPELRGEISLFAMTANGYTKSIGKNDRVQLGERIELRCAIRAGDGWNFSRLGPVKMQRQRTSQDETGKGHSYGEGKGYTYGDDGDSVTIISPDGCVNSAIKSVVPRGQIIDAADPKVVTLPMRAFIFNGMKDGDEMTLAVTIHGCLNYEDCFPDDINCEEWGWKSPNRIRRSLKEANTTDITEEISFKISIVAENLKKHAWIRRNNDDFRGIMLNPLTLMGILILFAAISTAIYTRYHYTDRLFL